MANTCTDAPLDATGRRTPSHPRYGIELVYAFGSCDWCSEEGELKEYDHPEGDVSEVCGRCFTIAQKQDERERLMAGDALPPQEETNEP